MAIVGWLLSVGVCWVLSENRSRVRWGLVFKCLILQLAAIVLVVGVPRWGLKAPLYPAVDFINDFVIATLDHSLVGSRFVFGPLAEKKESGFIFATQVLPNIILISALMALLYHAGIMQIVVRALGFLLQRLLGLGGAETLSAAANIFLGQTEAPLVVRRYLGGMSRSELFAVMVSGMASVAGGVMAAYVGLLKDQVPGIAGHLLAASVMSAPASFLFAKILIPDSGEPKSQDPVEMESVVTSGNFLESLSNGISEGLSLSVNVAAMLIGFTALLSLVNAGVSAAVGVFVPGAQFAVTDALSFGMVPVAWGFGFPVADLGMAARLLSEKLFLNEFVAYVSLATSGADLSEKSRVMASYALCGFANLSSIGIQIGGIGALVPDRRSEIASLGFKAVLAGTLASLSSAGWVGLLL